LYSVNPSSVSYSANESAISVTWDASATGAGVHHQLRCLSGSNGSVVIRNVTSPEQRLSATCDSLQSGSEFSLQIFVLKVGGFKPALAKVGQLLTSQRRPRSRPSAAAAESQPSESQPAEAVLLLNWTSSAAEGADLLQFRVSSASKPDLLREAAFISMRLLLSLAEAELLSLKLTVAVTAVANKSGLRQESSEIVIAEQLQMPPGRPSVSLLPDRRAVEVSLTASSGSELLTAAAHADSGSFAAATNSCRPDSGRCTVALQPLRPFTNYSVEAVAELSGLASLPQRSEVQTLEDAPSQPQSVRLDDASSQLLCIWRAPSEPNGVIRNYSVAWGSLSFPDGAEIRVGAEVTAADTTFLPLEPPPLPA
uniref:Fibronectin type-III domain-containing protein n=1 Tax=Macrostomum lignano TaxID=282301 RepID=A0A1I8GZ97_9PLAT